MPAPKNVRATKWPVYAMDPLLNFKFRLSWTISPKITPGAEGGDTVVVAFVSKIGALTRTTEVVDWREGGSPQVARKILGQVSYGDITLERGLIINTEFEKWANKVWFYENSGKTAPALGPKMAEVSLADFRKDLTIDLCNQAGQIMKQWMVFNCWPSEYQGMPELDGSGNDVALETMTIVNEGWQRNDAFKAPDYPKYSHPEQATS